MTSAPPSSAGRRGPPLLNQYLSALLVIQSLIISLSSEEIRWPGLATPCTSGETIVSIPTLRCLGKCNNFGSCLQMLCMFFL